MIYKTPNKWVKYVPLRSTGLATLRFASRLPKRYNFRTFKNGHPKNKEMTLWKLTLL